MSSNKKIKKKDVEKASLRKNSNYSDKRKAKQKKLAIITVVMLFIMVFTTIMGTLMSLF